MDGPNCLTPAEPTRSGVFPQHVKRALTYMRAHIQERIILADLAAACGISERALLKQFERFLGVSPIAHLMRMRLNAARTILQRSGRSVAISEAARRCGFTHLGRFATEYRKVFGELPSATQRRALKEADEAYTGNGACVPAAMPSTTRLLPSLLVLPLRTETLEERLVAQELMEMVAATLSSTRVATVAFADPAMVMSRLEVRAPKERAETQYHLHGRVVRRNERVRITLWLMDAIGRHVWGDSSDGPTDSMFDLLQQVSSSALYGVVRGVAGAELDRIGSKEPHTLSARETVLQSVPVWLRIDADSSRRAFAIACHAMDMDPDDALPVAVAAYAQARLFNSGKVESPDATSRRAFEFACRAAVLDAGDPLVVTARAAVASLLGAGEDADALVDRALAMDPTSGWAWERKGFLLWRDRPDDAIPCFNRALRLYSPLVPRDNCYLGIAQAHHAGGRIPEAIHWQRKALTENPRAHLPVTQLICLEHLLDRRSAARQWADHLKREHPDLTRSQLAWLYPDECFDRLLHAGLLQ